MTTNEAVSAQEDASNKASQFLRRNAERALCENAIQTIKELFGDKASIKRGTDGNAEYIVAELENGDELVIDIYYSRRKIFSGFARTLNIVGCVVGRAEATEAFAVVSGPP